jgi:glycosyltransferase involved in cell wall biosynthesis
MAATPSQAMLSVVVPVYNSEATLDALVLRLASTLAGSNYEILLVNDGSRDGSWASIERLARTVPEVRGIDLVRNSGQHNATLCGIRLARGEMVVTIDDDLQYRPEDIPLLLERLVNGVDVVYGKAVSGEWGRLRNLASKLMKSALRTAIGASTAEMVSSFRVLRAGVRDGFASYQAPLSNVDVLLTWGTSRFASVPVTLDRRRGGQSNYSFYTLFVHTWNMVTGFSTLPLQIATAVGFFFTLFGLAVLAYSLGRWAFFGAVQGFTFIASTISLFAGAQLFALGIMGEYIARVFQRTSGQPAYLVRHDTSEAPGAQPSAHRYGVTAVGR